MKFLKKYKIELLIFFGIVVLYIFLRLIHLLQIPIFTDEAIYIRWAQIAKQDASWRFISLTDGKQPMFIWMMIPFLAFFKDPLVAGRMVSVGSGFLSIVGLFLLGKELFKNRWIGIISALIYVLSPFALMYDRLALYDNMVATAIIWGLYVEVLFIRYLKAQTPYQLGFVIGAGMLVKTNAFFTMYLLPFSLLVFDWSKKDRAKRFVQWFHGAVIALIIATVLYNVLRLSPYFHIINEKNYTFIYSFSDWVKSPFAFLIGNLKGMSGWLVTYMTWPWLIASIASLGISWSYFKEKLLLLIWFLGPFTALAFFGKVIYPRYEFPMVVMLFPLIAFTCYSLFGIVKNKVVVVLVILALCSFAIRADILILTDIVHAPIPYGDLQQFIVDWPAGGGVKEIVSYLSNQASTQKIYVGTQGTFGLMPAALEIYLVKNSNITIRGFWPLGKTIPQEAVAAGKKMPAYFLFYQPCPDCPGIGDVPSEWPVKIVSQYHRNGTGTDMTLYQVNP